MALVAKEVAELFDLKIEKDDDLTMEVVRKQLTDNYIPRAMAHEDEKLNDVILGKKLGSLKTKLGSEFGKDLGFASNEIKELKIEDAVTFVATKAREKLKALQDAAGATGDEALKKLQAQLTQTTTERDTFKAATDELNAKLADTEKEWTGKLNSVKSETAFKSLLGEVEFSDDYKASPLLQTGFVTSVKSRYKFALDDNGNMAVHTADGKPVPHPKTPTKFLTAKEVLAHEAEELKVLKQNNTDPSRKKTVIVKTDDGGAGAGKTATGRPINKAALKAMEARGIKVG